MLIYKNGLKRLLTRHGHGHNPCIKEQVPIICENLGVIKDKLIHSTYRIKEPIIKALEREAIITSIASQILGSEFECERTLLSWR
jgi:hypothetical protein